MSQPEQMTKLREAIEVVRFRCDGNEDSEAAFEIVRKALEAKSHVTSPSALAAVAALREASDAFHRETGEPLRGVVLGRRAHSALLEAAACWTERYGTFNFMGIRIMLDMGAP